jgi:drug/metabolite transporter (DMT)-like permease
LKFSLWALGAVALGAGSYGALSTGVALLYQQGALLGDVVAAQFILGFLMLGLMCSVPMMRGSFWQGWTRSACLAWVLVGLCTTVIGFAYYAAVQRVGVAWGVLLLFQYPWFSLTLESILRKSWLRIPELLALMVLALGTWWAAGAQWQDLDVWGVIWGLCAAFAYGAFLFGAARINGQFSALSKAFVLQSGGLSAWLLAVFTCWGLGWSVGIPQWSFWSQASLEIWILALSLGFMGCVVPPLLMSWGLPKVGVFWGSLVSAIELPIAFLLAILLLGEEWTGNMLGGSLLVMCSVLVPHFWQLGVDWYQKHLC